MQLVCKIYNLQYCGPVRPYPPTSQTDRQTDGQTDIMQSQYRAVRAKH